MLQGLTDRLAPDRMKDEILHGVLPGFDSRYIQQRLRKPRPQRPRTHGGAGSVQQGQQRPFPPAFLYRRDQFQVPLGYQIEAHARTVGLL